MMRVFAYELRSTAEHHPRVCSFEGLAECEAAKSIEKHYEDRSKIDPRRRTGAPKIDSKSLPGPSRETPWLARASRGRLRSVSGASRSARRVAKDDPGRQKGYPGAPGSVPRRPKSTPSRVREQKNRVFFVQRIRKASSERLFSIFIGFRCFGEVCEPRP